MDDLNTSGMQICGAVKWRKLAATRFTLESLVEALLAGASPEWILSCEKIESFDLTSVMFACRSFGIRPWIEFDNKKWQDAEKAYQQ